VEEGWLARLSRQRGDGAGKRGWLHSAQPGHHGPRRGDSSTEKHPWKCQRCLPGTRVESPFPAEPHSQVLPAGAPVLQAKHRAFVAGCPHRTGTRRESSSPLLPASSRAGLFFPLWLCEAAGSDLHRRLRRQQRRAVSRGITAITVSGCELSGQADQLSAAAGEPGTELLPAPSGCWQFRMAAVICPSVVTGAAAEWCTCGVVT